MVNWQTGASWWAEFLAWRIFEDAVDSVGESLVYQKSNRSVGLGEGNANRCR